MHERSQREAAVMYIGKLYPRGWTIRRGNVHSTRHGKPNLQITRRYVYVSVWGWRRMVRWS